MREDKERAIATFTVELDEVREREAFFRKACQQKEREYQALMDEQLDGFTELEKLQNELKQANSELKARDRSLDNLQKQLEEKQQAIATLTTENQKLESFLAEAAKNEIFLSEELNRFKYGIVPSDEPCGEQLQLFPESPAVNLSPEKSEILGEETPASELDPETDANTKALQNSEPETVNRQPKPSTLTRGELMEHIRQNYPGAKVNPQNITDAINGKSKKMVEYESTYGFKYIGKIKGQYRFKILNKG